MVHRLLKIPLKPAEIKKELDILKQIAVANGYNDNVVMKTYKKLKNKFTHKNTKNKKGSNNEKVKYVSMTYKGNLSDKIEYKFRKAGVKLAFRTCNTLKLRLRHNLNHQKNDYNRSGVYRLKCNDCECFYIGQTGRSFTTRFREHTYSQNKTAFGAHLKDSKHNVGNIEHNMEILHKTVKGRKLDLLENIHIYSNNKKAPDKILNDQLEFSQKNFFTIFDDLL